MTPPALVLLDKDGVLIDLHARWGPVAAARARLVAERIPGLLASRVASWLGLSPEGQLGPGPMAHLGRDAIIREMVRWLETGGFGGESWRPTLEAAFREADTQAGPAVARPGVHDQLSTWRRAGIRLVVVTSDRTGHARHDLDRVGLLPLLDGVLGADRVDRGKPFPDLALAGARLVDEACDRAWLLGDTREDMAMAREAGVSHVIGLTGGACSREELSPWADRVVDGWTELALS